MIKFDFPNELPFLNTSAVKCSFFLQYPSGDSYWRIENQEGLVLKDGNYTFPKEVLDLWLESDDVLIGHLMSVEPWNV